MKLYEYENYEEYKEVQSRANRKKLNVIWVKRDSLDYLSKRLIEKMGKENILFGLCHGTRNGFEQNVLLETLDAKVIGTEISSTAKKFPNTIEWDFHDVKDEWVSSVDFIYSNALDHSYDPKLCLQSWMRCLRSGGYCVLHWSRGHSKPSKRDPFGATLGEYVDLIREKYYLEEVVQYTPNAEDKGEAHQYFLFIREGGVYR